MTNVSKPDQSPRHLDRLHSPGTIAPVSLPAQIVSDILTTLFLTYLVSHKFRKACQVLINDDVARQVYRLFFRSSAPNMKEQLINALRICDLVKIASAHESIDHFGMVTFNRRQVFIGQKTCWGLFELTLLILPLGEVLSTIDFTIAIRGASDVKINWLCGPESQKCPYYNNPVIVLSSIGPITTKQTEPRLAGVSKLIKKSFGANCGIFSTNDYDYESGDTVVDEI